MHRTLRRSLLPAMVVATLATTVAPTPVLAATTTCSYDSATHVLTVSMVGDGYTGVLRRPDTTVIEVGGHLCYKPGSFLMASVHNTRRIVVIGDAEDQAVSVALVGGGLGPGFGDEPGDSDEIEVRVDLEAGHDFLYVIGGARSDALRAGTSNGVTSINLNARERAGIDADLRATGVEALALHGAWGDDQLSARGGRGTGAELATSISLVGDRGDDLLVGGAGPDQITTLTLGDEPLTDDHDVARGRGGADGIDVQDADGLDEATGGGGVDTCFADVADTVVC